MNNYVIKGSLITVKIKIKEIEGPSPTPISTTTFEFKYSLPNKEKHPDSLTFWTKELVHKFIY